jgi:hypothetical protein
LPPLKGARPNLGFKEIEAPHVFENIYFPGRPDWKPIEMVLYDYCIDGNHPNGTHPIFQWIRRIYEVNVGYYRPIAANVDVDPSVGSSVFGFDVSFKKNGYLDLYDGCGNVIESWRFDNCWPLNANFGELDMGNSEVLTCDVTLRYDRAYEVVTDPFAASSPAQPTYRDVPTPLPPPPSDVLHNFFDRADPALGFIGDINPQGATGLT